MVFGANNDKSPDLLQNRSRKGPILPESPFSPYCNIIQHKVPMAKFWKGSTVFGKCYFEVRMNCKGAFLYSQVPGHKFQASEEIVIDLHALLYCNICSSSYFNGTHTWFCREVDYVANTHFLVLIRLQIWLRQMRFDSDLTQISEPKNDG